MWELRYSVPENHSWVYMHACRWSDGACRARRLNEEIEVAEDAGDEAKADELRATKQEELMKKLR